MKIFKKQTDEKPYVIEAKADNEEQPDEDHGDAGSEESELQLIVDVKNVVRKQMKIENRKKEDTGFNGKLGVTHSTLSWRGSPRSVASLGQKIARK